MYMYSELHFLLHEFCLLTNYTHYCQYLTAKLFQAVGIACNMQTEGPSKCRYSTTVQQLIALLPSLFKLKEIVLILHL